MGAPRIEKRCGACKIVKPVGDFYKAGAGFDCYCKECRRKKDRERTAKRDGGKSMDEKRDYKLQRMYGISLTEYDAMFLAQNGVCAICLQPEKRRVYGMGPRLVVDHNHTTGKVRALLCTKCNCSLHAIEDEQFMLRAKEYLERQDGYQFI